MKYLIYDKIRLGVAVLLCFCTALQTDAKVKLPALISDGMVLQREQPVKIWGTADAGESVSVTFMKILVKSSHTLTFFPHKNPGNLTAPGSFFFTFSCFYSPSYIGAYGSLSCASNSS